MRSKWFKALYGALCVTAASVLMAVSAFAEEEASTASNTQSTGLFGNMNKNSIITIVLMIALVAVMYFVMIRPQRKKEKETAQMRDSIQPGDKVVTIGGIVGKVCSVKEDVVTIETGSDKVRIKFVKNAISSVQKPKVDTVEKKEGTDKKMKVLKRPKKSEEPEETAPEAPAETPAENAPEGETKE